MPPRINFYDSNESTASFYKTTLAHFLIFLILLFYFQSSLCDFFCWKRWLEVSLSFELQRHNYQCEDTWGCLSEVTSSNHKRSRDIMKMKTVSFLLYPGSSFGCFTQKGNKALGMRWQIAPLSPQIFHCTIPCYHFFSGLLSLHLDWTASHGHSAVIGICNLKLRKYSLLENHYHYSNIKVHSAQNCQWAHISLDSFFALYYSPFPGQPLLDLEHSGAIGKNLPPSSFMRSRINHC